MQGDVKALVLGSLTCHGFQHTCIFAVPFRSPFQLLCGSPTVGIGPRVGEVKAPVLVMWGRHDKILPAETVEKFAAALPDATISFLEASGHSGHLEEPDLAFSTIVAFIEANL